MTGYVCLAYFLIGLLVTFDNMWTLKRLGLSPWSEIRAELERELGGDAPLWIAEAAFFLALAGCVAAWPLRVR